LFREKTFAAVANWALSKKPFNGFAQYIINVIKFVSDLQQVSGFLRAFRFPPPIKLAATI
jgi:hypothetical protein